MRQNEEATNPHTKYTPQQLIIQRPATRHMFDRKTARTKPFVITMMGETEASLLLFLVYIFYMQVLSSP